MTSNETIIDQIPRSVRDFSSQYSSNSTRSYAIENICSDASIYPHYGDSTNALVFRTYGPWWIDLPSYKSSRRAFKRPENEFISRDFVEIEYAELVHRCTCLKIYETYNPGSLEVVYAGREESDGSISWQEVWRFPQPFSILLRNNEEYFIENGRQQMLDLFPDHVNTTTSIMHSLQLNTDHQLISKIHTKHSYPPAARFARILKIPLEKKISFPTRHIRLEFDHCTANYYIEIDTIKLCGYLSPSNTAMPVINSTISDSVEIIPNNSPAHITQLPFDILFLICSQLDLRSLVRFSSTCRLFRQQCLHGLQFLAVNLQPYWNRITNHSIENFFLEHCTQTRSLSLAWTKSISHSPFEQLLNVCSDRLIQLDLGNCGYLNRDYLETITCCCPNVEWLNLENCIGLTGEDFLPLTDLQHLRSLNVYRTRIDYRTILPVIHRNQEHLEHINLGSCQNLIDTAGILKFLFGRCKNLRSVDLWRARHLAEYDYFCLLGSPIDEETEAARLAMIPAHIQDDIASIYSIIDMPFAIPSLHHLHSLTEIDFGWTQIPGGFIKGLVEQAGHSLIKIFLAACRNVNNADFFAISANCSQLRQLDILGCNIITEEAVESILKYCSHIQFIDISFCGRISTATVATWIHQYRNCFKRSYQPITDDDVYHEFP